MKRLLAFALLLLVPLPAGAAPQLGGPLAPDGKTHVQLYLAPQLRMFNSSGRDGAGLCVFTSVEMAGHYQNVEELIGFQKKMERELGGGTPNKLKAMLEKYAPGVQVLQHTAGDVEFLKKAIAGGRMPCVTYAGMDPYYGKDRSGRPQRVAHMVDMAHLDGNFAAVMDNNHPLDRQTKADNQYVWMTPTEFVERWKAMKGGWAVVLLAPPPPPAPPLVQQGPTNWPTPTSARPVSCEWRTWQGHPDHTLLYRDGKLTGYYSFAGDCYRTYNPATKKWEDNGPAPVLAPTRADVGGTFMDYGVTPWDGAPEYMLDGEPITRAEAFKLLEQCPGPSPCPLPKPKPGPKPTPKPSPSPSPSPTPLPDDTSAMPLTIVSNDAALRAKVRADLEGAAELSPWRGKLSVQDYPEGAPMLVSAGLPAAGFHILLQLPRASGFPGRIVMNLTSYDGPAALAGALKRADPTYKDAEPPAPKAPPANPPTSPSDKPQPPPQSPAIVPQPAGPAMSSLATLLPGILMLIAALANQFFPQTKEAT